MAEMDLDKPPVEPTQPRFEFAFEVRLKFHRQPNIDNIPSGGQRGFVCVESGNFEGPNIKGKAVPYSGGDYAHVRTDGVVSFDAMYLLEEDDGSRILLRNRGFTWYKDPETAAKIKSGEINHWAMSPEGYYFRTAPVFEAPGGGKHDWLNKTIMVGCGARVENGNVIRYYKVV